MTQITYTQRVLPLFTLSLAVATIGTIIGWQFLSFLSNPVVSLVLAVIEIVLIIMVTVARRSREVGGLLLFAFVFVSGLVLSPLIALYIAADGAGIIAQAFIITTVVFAGLSYYAYISGKSFSQLGGILFIGLIGVIIASVVNIFLGNPLVYVIVDIVSIVVFSGLILYNTGQILTKYTDDDIYPAVLSLYLDFLNLFLDILELLGIFRRRN